MMIIAYINQIIIYCILRLFRERIIYKYFSLYNIFIILELIKLTCMIYFFVLLKVFAYIFNILYRGFINFDF